MHRQLLDLLICPACLPEERPLKAHIRETRAGDVHTAELTCPGCRQDYRVDHGMACLLPPRRDSSPLEDKYTTTPVVSSYLWSHYADLFDDPRAHGAYAAWANLLAPAEGLVLDAGCAVGRLSFELAPQAELVIGIDRSQAFIRTARTLAVEGRLTFGLVMEGDLTEHREIRLDPSILRGKVEFLLADALALPFPGALFGTASSLNLLDKVPSPRRHLDELNRVAARREANLLISDPWSWSPDVAPKTAWLGGIAGGPWAGHGHVNLRRLLSREMTPPWQVTAEGTVPWKIRNHRNHYELIDSDYLLAKR